MANRKSVRHTKTTSEDSEKMATYTVSPGNFWDIGNYSRCIERIKESYSLLDDLVLMFKERISIEQKYSERLGKWHQKWSKHMEAAPLYATMKMAVLGTLKEANDIAQIHQDSYIKIENQVIHNIRSHKEQYYHKNVMGGLKESKHYEEEFVKAQKQWAAAFNKVHKSKKSYHSACKNKEIAEQQLTNSQKDAEATPDKIKKNETTLREREKQASLMKKKYEEKLSRIGPLNRTYEDEMRSVYDRWAKDEERRVNFIQRTLVEYHKSVNIVDDKRLKDCYDNQISVAYSGKSQHDVKWWTENFGADMPRNWPKFEELGDQPDAPPPVSAVEPPPPVSQNDYSQQSTGYVPNSNSQYSVSSNHSDGGTIPANNYAVQPATHEDVESNPALNPFANGGDGFDDDDDDDWDDAPPPPLPGGGIPVRALYDYSKVEDDELTFQAGDVLTKLTEEDKQGWCRGRLNGLEGLYPANYVENI